MKRFLLSAVALLASANVALAKCDQWGNCDHGNAPEKYNTSMGSDWKSRTYGTHQPGTSLVFSSSCDEQAKTLHLLLALLTFIEKHCSRVGVDLSEAGKLGQTYYLMKIGEKAAGVKPSEREHVIFSCGMTVKNRYKRILESHSITNSYDLERCTSLGNAVNKMFDDFGVAPLVEFNPTE